MTYTTQTWLDGPGGGTPISAPRLTHMETGIKDASNRLDAIDATGYVTDAEFTAGLAPKANTASLAAVALSGSATDITTGTLPTSVLPALAITDVFTVDSQAQMLALTAQRGDVAIRTDLPATFILAAEPASTLANWKQIALPADAVLSVNGQSGIVVLSKADIGLGNVDNTSDSGKPISTAAQTALNGLDTRLDAVEAELPNKVDVTTPQTLTFGATVNTDAALGEHFRLTATGNFTLANPTNLVDGQKITFEIRQDGTGSRVPTLGSLFNLGGQTLAWSTAADKIDYLGVVYRTSGAASPKLDVLAFRAGL